ncbi:hypothetical protein ONZ51_g7259 [Trametes cubensis]|uniref:Uncharacterized protein n=1 Tax=Trametes cubensis TaxID=1111947 RepID=A0AAD7XBZ7_9APHY|nr:hypothetical protein ONZ51_g7259 [Trametes cubensis]
MFQHCEFAAHLCKYVYSTPSVASAAASRFLSENSDIVLQFDRMSSQPDGWVYVDDDDYQIQFSDGWGVTRSIQQAYDNTMHAVSNLQDATAAFHFTGTAVAVYGAVGDVAHNGWPSTSYAVDGVVYETYDFVTASGYSDATQLRYQVPYFTLQDLPAVDHILVITNLNGTAPNTYWLDYIRFLPFGSGSSASANPGLTSSPILTSTPSSTPIVTVPASTMGDDSAGDSRREGAVVGGAVGGGIILVVFLAISATFTKVMRSGREGDGEIAGASGENSRGETRAGRDEKASREANESRGRGFIRKTSPGELAQISAHEHS